MAWVDTDIPDPTESKKPKSFGQDELVGMVIDKANQYGVPPAMALSVARQESGLKPLAKSPTGVRGLFQVTLDTGRIYKPDYNEKDRGNPEISADIGIRRLADLHKSHGDWSKALKAYNGGSDPRYEYNVGRHLDWARKAVNSRSKNGETGQWVDVGEGKPQ